MFKESYSSLPYQALDYVQRLTVPCLITILRCHYKRHSLPRRWNIFQLKCKALTACIIIIICYIHKTTTGIYLPLISAPCNIRYNYFTMAETRLNGAVKAPKKWACTQGSTSFEKILFQVNEETLSKVLTVIRRYR